MRDPKRIQIVLDLINEIWSKDPDLRFMQLLYILQYGYSDKNNENGRIKEIEKDGHTRIGFNLFAVEDDAFIEFLTEVNDRGGIKNIK
jgi:hypothetical protein